VARVEVGVIDEQNLLFADLRLLNQHLSLLSAARPCRPPLWCDSL
jgi:hypothetical protein